MNSSRILGGLLSVVSALVAILHLYYGYINAFLKGSSWVPSQGLAFALPVTVLVLIATGLGFWLGWIMATTKEAEPSPAPTVEEEESEEIEVEGEEAE